MAKKSKLLAALDAHKSRDYEVEKQKKFQKQAEKKKRSKASSVLRLDSEEKKNVDVANNGSVPISEAESEGWESDGSEAIDPALIDTSRLLEDESDSDTSLGGDDADPPEVDKDEDGDAIPLSDIESLASDEKADILPHQRLTINNTSALQKAHKSISLAYSSLPFSAHQTVTTNESVSISDVNDDLNRELAFYKQCLDAANVGRGLLKKEGVPFSRPTDYFAEMVKSDEHMGKIKQKMVDEASNKKAGSEARRQRDLKKFGKQVQVAKLQERDKAKRETLDKINLLKRKRKNTDTAATNEEDIFEVALEDAAKEDRSSKSARNGFGRPENKRRKKDEKFGFGGKKRFSKSGDAASTADMSRFSAKGMKGLKKGAQRLGKSRRAKMS